MKTGKFALMSFAALVAASVQAAPTVISGSITTDTQWSPAASPDGYILDGIVFVKSGATLDIAAGTIIRGQPKSGVGALDPGVLVVTRTGQIQARGTSGSPIIFTTAAVNDGTGNFKDTSPADGVADKWTPADGTNFLDANPVNVPLAPLSPTSVKNTSLWGGVIIAGNAPVNAAQDVSIPGDGTPEQGQGFMEGLSSTTDGIYGGTDVLDSSGIIKYVSIRHGGYELASGREINGLTLYGVGRGTTVDHIDIYCNSDDGVEVFGGTVNLSYLNINFCEDDGLDVDEGHQGTVQFVYVVHGLISPSSSDPRGMELDGDDKGETSGDATLTSTGAPFQDTRMYNFTVQTVGQRGVVMRRSFGGALINSIIAGNASGETGIEITSADAGVPATSAQNRYELKELQIRNTTINGYTTLSTSWTDGITYTPHTNTGHATSVYYPATGNSTNNADMLVPTLAASGINPRAGAGPGSPSGSATGSPQTQDYVVAPAVSTTYRGAFPTAATPGDLWTTGWTAANKTNTAGVKVLVN